MTREDAEPRPPTAQQVARRALILAALSCRGFIETGAGNSEAEELLLRIRNWLQSTGLCEHLEPEETQVIDANLGELEAPQAHRIQWAVEGLSVLAWAVGDSGFPSHDQQVDPYAITDSVGLLSAEAPEFIASAQLRTANELKCCRELMYAVHCRLRDFLRGSNRRDFSSWVDQRWPEVLRLDPARLFVGNELAVGGRALPDVPRNLVQQCEWAVCERHRASIWLIGEEHPTYWNWGVDT